MATRPLTSLRIHDYPILPVPAPPLHGDIDVYSQDGKLFAVTNEALREIAYEPVGRSRILVHQVDHNFIVGDVVRSAYADNTFIKAQANNPDNAEADGIVDEILDDDNFYLLMVGELVNDIVPDVDPGIVLFLSVTTPGLLTTDQAVNYGEVSKPMAIVIESGHRMFVVHYRSIEIIEDPGWIGWSGYSGYSGQNALDLDGGHADSVYGGLEVIDGGHL